MTFSRRSNEYAFAMHHYWQNLSKMSINLVVKDYSKFMAPFTFQGGCNADVFNTWLKNILLPELPKGTTVVMDNAAFHKSAKTRELIEGAGCFLLYLPTYSPDFNPIEHCWHTLKSRLKPLIQHCNSNMQKLIGECLLTI
jgi:transposase